MGKLGLWIITGLICSTTGNFIFEEQLADYVQRTQIASDGITNLALGLEQTISSSEPGKNTLFSPLCIASALALLLLGASGRTEMELGKLMGVKTGVNLTQRSHYVHDELGQLLTFVTSSVMDNPAGVLSSATALFPQYNYHINPNYVKSAVETYYSDVIGVDYQYHSSDALNTINGWVYNRTRGRIPKILEEPPSTSTALIVASALYFTSAWEHPFLPHLTKVKPFYLETNGGPEQVVKVPMMANVEEVLYLNDKARKFEFLGLPYKGKDVYMYILLPDKDLRGFLRRMTISDLYEMMNETKKQQVIYVVPKVKLDVTLNLKPVFEKLGLKGLFDPNYADLSKIADGIFINQILHKVEIEINENGTTASAATAGSLKRQGSIPVMRVEKPFMFFIVHQQKKALLFWGTVMNPVQGDAVSSLNRFRNVGHK